MLRVAILAAGGFVLIAAFQLALALGAPLGEASWGGRHRGRLPPRLRLASAGAVVVWALAVLVVLVRGGVEGLPIPASVARWGTWGLVGALGLGAVMNSLTPSRWERFLWAPFTLALAVLTLLVARGPT